MTYKTLVRKSDGQWMRITNRLAYPSTFPVLINPKVTMDIIRDELTYEDCSEFELEEVYVTRKSEVPSAKDLHNWMESQYEDHVLDAYEIFSWLKSQILKP